MGIEKINIIEEIKNSPNFIEIYNEMSIIIEKERQKRKEFYNLIHEDVNAEFINGEIIFHSPVKLWHSTANINLSTLISIFLAKNDIGIVRTEKLMVRLTRNDYEPDICFFLNEKAKGFKTDQMLFPAPDFVVEILSASTERTDRTIKFHDYKNHGVQEYWIVDPEKMIVEQYVLRGKDYYLKLKSDSGTISSTVIKGFKIPVKAIFDKVENTKAIADLL